MQTLDSTRLDAFTRVRPITPTEPGEHSKRPGCGCTYCVGPSCPLRGGQ